MPDARTPEEIVEAVRRAKADADQAEFDLVKAREEHEEWKAGRARRDEDAASTSLAAQLKNAESDRAGVKDLVPDLTKVERGETTAPDKASAFQALLSGRAIQAAANETRNEISGANGLQNNSRVLVTTEVDIASNDAGYQSLLSQLNQLNGCAESFLAPPKHDLAPVVAGAIIAAQLLPGLLSLVSAKRTVSSSDVTTVDDTLAAVCVAGSLAEANPGMTVVLDRTRLLSGEGKVATAWADLQRRCAEMAEVVQDLEGKTGDQARPERVAEGKRLIKTCQDALASVASVPEGGKISALARAQLQEAYHSDQFDRVLLIKGSAASSTQLLDDRPLAFGDPLTIVSTASIAYALIDPADSRVRLGGIAFGSEQVHGKIGDTLPMPE